MAGLRERKKENRKNRIFGAALKLFEELGFEKTTMEKIALDADLGVGTLYNYYSSKTVLLFSIIETGTEKYIEEMNGIINQCDTINESIFAFFNIYLKSFGTYGKKVWKELFAESMFRHPEMMKMVDGIDQLFLGKLSELLTLCKNKGEIKENTDITTAVTVLYSILAYNVMRYISIDEMAELVLTEELKKQASLILAALHS